MGGGPSIRLSRAFRVPFGYFILGGRSRMTMSVAWHGSLVESLPWRDGNSSDHGNQAHAARRIVELISDRVGHHPGRRAIHHLAHYRGL